MLVKSWRAMLLLALGICLISGCSRAEGAVPVAPGPAVQVPTVDSLVYQGAEVQTQVDVNGAAAMVLLGKGLDSLSAQAQKQAAALQSAGNLRPGERAKLAVAQAVLPILEPTKETLKSLDHLTFVLLQPKAPVSAADFTKFYAGCLASQGWSSLFSLQDKSGTAVVSYMAPEGRGVFFAVNQPSTIVVALVTTTRPIGDLLNQIIDAGGNAVPTLVQEFLARRQPPVAPAPPKPAPKLKPSK